MSTEIVTVETCTHPELNMQDEIGMLGERVYWCSACKKRITIPMYQSSLSGRDAQENFAGMIGLAFGEQWERLARKGQV